MGREWLGLEGRVQWRGGGGPSKKAVGARPMFGGSRAKISWSGFRTIALDISAPVRLPWLGKMRGNAQRNGMHNHGQSIFPEIRVIPALLDSAVRKLGALQRQDLQESLVKISEANPKLPKTSEKQNPLSLALNC